MGDKGKKAKNTVSGKKKRSASDPGISPTVDSKRKKNRKRSSSEDLTNLQRTTHKKKAAQKEQPFTESESKIDSKTVDEEIRDDAKIGKQDEKDQPIDYANRNKQLAQEYIYDSAIDKFQKFVSQEVKDRSRRDNIIMTTVFWSYVHKQARKLLDDKQIKDVYKEIVNNLEEDAWDPLFVVLDQNLLKKVREDIFNIMGDRRKGGLRNGNIIHRAPVLQAIEQHMKKNNKPPEYAYIESVMEGLLKGPWNSIKEDIELGSKLTPAELKNHLFKLLDTEKGIAYEGTNALNYVSIRQAIKKDAETSAKTILRDSQSKSLKIGDIIFDYGGYGYKIVEVNDNGIVTLQVTEEPQYEDEDQVRSKGDTLTVEAKSLSDYYKNINL